MFAWLRLQVVGFFATQNDSRLVACARLQTGNYGKNGRKPCHIGCKQGWWPIHDDRRGDCRVVQLVLGWTGP